MVLDLCKIKENSGCESQILVPVQQVCSFLCNFNFKDLDSLAIISLEPLLRDSQLHKEPFVVLA